MINGWDVFRITSDMSHSNGMCRIEAIAYASTPENKAKAAELAHVYPWSTGYILILEEIAFQLPSKKWCWEWEYFMRDGDRFILIAKRDAQGSIVRDLDLPPVAVRLIESRFITV